MTPKEPHPIGIGLTLFYSVMVLVFYVLIQNAVLKHFFQQQNGSAEPKDINEILKALSTDATTVSTGIILGAFSAIIFLVLLIRFRKVDVKEHLMLYSFAFRDLLNWFVVLIGFTITFALVAWLISHETPDFMLKIWSTRDNTLLLLFAIVIAAPVFEELLFRGFMFSGIQKSHLGTAAAIVISSAFWAMIHTQYGSFELIAIFILGIVLAVSRIASGSIYVPILLHASNNLFAVLEMALLSKNVAQ